MHSIQQKQEAYNNDKLQNNKQNSTENPYDRLFNNDEPSLKTKFADVFNSLANNFSNGQSEKAANNVANSKKSNQKAELDKEKRLKEEEDEKERKKIAQNKAQEHKIAENIEAQEQKDAQYEDDFIERPSDILAATFAAQGLISQNNVSGSASASTSSSTSGSSSNSGSFSGSSSNSGGSAINQDLANEAEQDEASLKMAELESSQNDELDAIEERLNKLSREELNKQHNAYQDELQEQEHQEIARLNNKDLKKNLDNLAREANVSKISLKMDNPQTLATERRNAEAIANLPSSNPNTTGLKSLVAPNAVQNAIYNSLNSGTNSANTPVSGSHSASISGSSSTISISGSNTNNVLASDNKIISRSAVAGMATAKLDTIGNTNLVADRAAIKENIKLNQAAEALSIAASKLGAVDKGGFGIGSEALKVSAQSVDTKNTNTNHIENDNDEFNFKAKDVIASLQEVADDLEAEANNNGVTNFKQSAFGRGMSPLMAEAEALASMDMSVAAKALAKGLSQAIDESNTQAPVDNDTIVNAVKDKELTGSSKAIAAALKLAQAVEHNQGEVKKEPNIKHNNNIVIDKNSSAYTDNSSKASLIALAEQTQKTNQTKITSNKMPDFSLDEYTARSSLTNDASLYKAKNSSTKDSISNALASLKDGFKGSVDEAQAKAQAPEDQGQDLNVFTQGAKGDFKSSAIDSLLSSQQNSMQKGNGGAFLSFAGSIGTFSETNVALNPHDSANLAAQYGGMTFSESLNHAGVAQLYENAAKKAREILELNYAQKVSEDNISNNNIQASNIVADNMAQEANIAKNNSAKYDVLDFNKPNNALLNMYLAPDPEDAAAQINERILQMAARNMRHLTVELAPNDLGRMRISIDMSADNEALAVSLAAVDQNTRDALEQSLPKLKEILAQQNIFTDAKVVELKDSKLASKNKDEISEVQSA